MENQGEELSAGSIGGRWRRIREDVQGRRILPAEDQPLLLCFLPEHESSDGVEAADDEEEPGGRLRKELAVVG
jgi:hypothetical protein